MDCFLKPLWTCFCFGGFKRGRGSATRSLGTRSVREWPDPRKEQESLLEFSKGTISDAQKMHGISPRVYCKIFIEDNSLCQESFATSQYCFPIEASRMFHQLPSNPDFYPAKRHSDSPPCISARRADMPS